MSATSHACAGPSGGAMATGWGLGSATATGGAVMATRLSTTNSAARRNHMNSDAIDAIRRLGFGAVSDWSRNGARRQSPLNR